MMRNFTLFVQLSISDLPEILELVDSLSGEQKVWNQHINAKWLLSEFTVDSVGVFGWREDEKLCTVLFARSLTDIFEITFLATHQKRARRGFMIKTMKKFLSCMEGGEKVWLEVHESNFAAQQMYLKAGFSADNRRKGYYADGSDAILFSLQN